MQNNRLKEKLRKGGVATIVTGCQTPGMVDFIGSLGVFDAVWIEMEHGAVTWADLEGFSRAADLWGMSSVVRVQSNDETVIGRALSLGPDGIIVPHITTRAEAERVVDAALFAPTGHRGAAAGRKSYGRPSYFDEANDETFIMVLIEDINAIDNLDDILQVPHIDVFFVTRSDLAQSMGRPTTNDGHLSTDPEVLAVRDHAVERIVAAGRHAGVGMTERDFEKYISMGVTFTRVALTRFIASGATDFANELRNVGG